MISTKREFDREVGVFLFRTIRRRLVSLFAGALVLMIFLAAIGIVGLIWHQEAVDDLDFLLHRSPNRDHLSRSMSRIHESFYTSLDLKKVESVETLRIQYRASVKDAQAALFDFRRRVESLPPSSQLSLQQRNQVLQRLDGIYGEVLRLAHLERFFHITTNAEQIQAQADIQFQAGLAVNRIQKTLEAMPAYQTHNWVELSLNKERERSSRLLTILLYATGVVLVFFFAILTCGFQWISIPLRAISKDCTRIANGDINHRLSTVSRWQDEFMDLVAGVNCMADRFQQSEEDLQYKVQERSEQLVRSQRLVNVGILAAGVAHEINNPLSAISMAAESLEFRLYDLMEMESQEAREVMDRVAMIRKESRRCGDITARLLNFSSGEKTGRAHSDIAEIVREVMLIVQHLGQFQDRHVVFDCDRCVRAEIDASQLKQVILNLVTNALFATEPGGEVSIHLQEQVDNVVVSIADDGCGMDTETLQHIFDPFFTTRAIGQGTGLGLSITHRIVEDHGGTIIPTSPGPGCGSTFKIRLPRRQRQANAA